MRTAGALLHRFEFWRSSAGRFFVCNDLLESLDSVGREGGHAVLTDAVDPQAAVFGFHVYLEVPQPFFILAELFGDVLERNTCEMAAKIRLPG